MADKKRVYHKPLFHFSEEEWSKITNIVNNPSGELAIKEAESFNFPEEISNKIANLKKELPTTSMPETLSLLYGMTPAGASPGILFQNFLNMNNIFDRKRARDLLDKYQNILTDNYNKLPKKSQQIGVKEAIKARTPISTSDSNLNQRPQYQGGIQ